ncbi:MAG: DUF1554 domain-containing protein [Leptospiraceae bacterium]|nr:DUF1554 domain-containing protein [Leptospiraceae bacterium]
MKIAFVLLMLNLFNCQDSGTSPNLKNFLLIRDIFSTTQVIVNGNVSTMGTLPNAKVSAYRSNSSGECLDSEGNIKGTLLASSLSDVSGNFTLKYTRTLDNVCILTDDSGSTKLVLTNPTNNRQSSIPFSKGGHFASLFRDSNFTSSGNYPYFRRKTNPSPISRLVASRIFSKSFNTKNLTKLTQTSINEANQETIKVFFRLFNPLTTNLDEINITDDTNQILMGGLHALATDNFKIEDASQIGIRLSAILNYMEQDFRDGIFDGKTIDSTGTLVAISTSLQNQAIGTASPNTFLEETYVKGIDAFLKLKFPSRSVDSFGFGTISDDTSQQVSQSSKDFLSFGFLGITNGTSVINKNAGTISFAATTTQSIDSLIAEFKHNGASVKVGAQRQTTGVTSNNFSSQVTYRITSFDGDTKDYQVTVNLSAPTKRTFRTTNTYTGNLGGFTGADSICNSDPAKPNSSTYKALILASDISVLSNRRFPPSTDWVLTPNTNYARANGTTIIFTTNSNSIFPMGTFTNSWTGTVGTIYTGISNSATWGSMLNPCATAAFSPYDSWTNSSGIARGCAGDTNQVGSTALSSGVTTCAVSEACNIARHLICVEQ